MVRLVLFPRCEFFQPLLYIYLFFRNFPEIKIEGILWFISYYSPRYKFFSLSFAPIYLSTSSRILKLKAFRGTSHIVLPCEFI